MSISPQTAASFPIAPDVVPPMDSTFCPASLAMRWHRQQVAAAEEAPGELVLAVERQDGAVSRRRIRLLPSDHRFSSLNDRIADRELKFLLWARGGFRVTINGPGPLCARLIETYQAGGARDFDRDIVQKVYDRGLTIVEVENVSDLPGAREAATPVGGHLDGCRIGFDLGASDYKLAAVRDGEPVFSTEIPWDPVPQSDPGYHYQRISEGLRQAAEHLPRVDAIGGSAAGIYIENQPRVASLFRGIPESRFGEVRTLFERLQGDWGVPLVVVNDGDVTALAGALSLGKNNLLGIAMGSSEAAGFIDARGRITGCLNELAFAPVDFSLTAPEDEWSGDTGVGAQYFSQQAVGRLAAGAGFAFPASMPLPEQLKRVQTAAEKGDERAEKLFATIGTYLGYALPHYREIFRLFSKRTDAAIPSVHGSRLVDQRVDRVTVEGRSWLLIAPET